MSYAARMRVFEKFIWELRLICVLFGCPDSHSRSFKVDFAHSYSVKAAPKLKYYQIEDPKFYLDLSIISQKMVLKSSWLVMYSYTNLWGLEIAIFRVTPFMDDPLPKLEDFWETKYSRIHR
jgi:hypothetical protein